MFLKKIAEKFFHYFLGKFKKFYMGTIFFKKIAEKFFNIF